MQKKFDITIRESETSKNFLENANALHFQQTSFWGEFKARHGWTHRLFEIEWRFLGDEHNAPKMKKDTVSVMIRTFSRFFSIAYIPLYPALPFPFEECDENKTSHEEEGGEACTDGRAIIDASSDAGVDARQCADDEASAETAEEAEEDAGDGVDTDACSGDGVPSKQTIEFADLLEGIAFSLKKFLPKNTLCVRFDPDVDFSTPELRDEFNYGVVLVSFADRLKVRKNSVDIQPPDTTIVDLTKTEDEILSSMKSKWRYNIHLAERKGVYIEKISGNDINLSEKIDIFYTVYKITSERDGIALHPKSYYQDLMELSVNQSAQSDTPIVNLYIAKHEDDYLGAIMTLFTKKEGVYLYGASSNVKRNFMPNFLLQWTAMKDAKKYGSACYDLYGMPPTDDENHPMHGLYLFKTGFGGRNVHRVGSYDVRLSALYGLCTRLESLRAWWHKKFLKKIRGR